MSIETKWEADTSHQMWLEEKEQLLNARGSIKNLLYWWTMPIRWAWHGNLALEGAREMFRIGWDQYTGKGYTDFMKQR